MLKISNWSKVWYKSLWISLIVFALGSAISISLEELGAFFAMVSFGLLLITKREKIKSSIIDIPILLIVIGLVLSSLVVSSDKLRSLRGNLNNLWMIPLFYVIISSLTIKQYKKILNIILWVSLIAAVYGIWQSLTGNEFVKHHDLIKLGKLYYATGFWGLHLTYGGFMGMVALVALGLSVDVNITKQKFFYYSAASLTMIATFLSFSRSAIVGTLIGLFFFVIVNIKKTYKIFIILLIGLILLFSFTPSLRYRMNGVLSPTYLHSIYRYQIWMTAINMIKNNPILGVGGASDFSELYKKYNEPNFDRPAMPHAHNDVLNMYVEVGILAFLGYLSLFVLLILLGLKIFFRTKEMFLLGLISSIIVMSIQGLS